MKPQMIDIGSNLTHASFATDLDEVLARAVAAGVTRQIVTGAALASSTAAAALAAARPGGLWSTAGFHPHHAAAYDPAHREDLIALLRRPEVVAVGECGLDYHRNLAPPAAQRAAFADQLEIAVAVGKPVFLHQRDAHEDFLAILRSFADRLRGVAHCFTGGRGELDDYLSLGLSIGVTGWVCDERRGSQLREAVGAIPATRLMVETDSPYLLPRDLDPQPRSRRNEPMHLPHVVRRIAQLRGEDWSDVAAASTLTAETFFGLTPRAAPAES